MDSFIEIKDLSYHHLAPYSMKGKKSHNLPILRNISLSIKEGEFISIIGANGSGKTTLARHINALLLPTQGKVIIDGLDTRVSANQAHIRNKVGFVFQSPEDQMVATLVEEDVAFGLENLGIPSNEIRSRVNDALNAVDMGDYSQHPTHLLSGGQTQRVAIAAWLAIRPRAIILDEATAMLDPQGRLQVMGILSTLHKQGMTVIFITHFMEEAAMAERIIVLHQGQVVMDGSPQQIFSDSATLKKYHLALPGAAQIGNQIHTHFPSFPIHLLSVIDVVQALNQEPRIKERVNSLALSKTAYHQVSPASYQNPIIEIRHLDHTYLAETPLSIHSLKDISLNICKNEVHGIVGASGCGKSTLLQHMDGLIRPQKGSLRIENIELNDQALDLRPLRKMVAFSFQNPENYFFEQYVGDEIAFGLHQIEIKDSKNIRNKVKESMEMMGLDFDLYKDRLTFTLSSGESRKVAMASLLAMDAQILLFDEPTAGLDPCAHQDLLTVFSTLQAKGKTLIIASHQMEDQAAFAQNITVLKHGEIILSGMPQEVFSQPTILSQAGLLPPPAVQIAAELRDYGWLIPTDVLTPPDLVHVILGLDVMQVKNVSL